MRGHKAVLSRPDGEEPLQLIQLDGFHILEKRKIQLSQVHVMEFYAEHVGKPFFTKLQVFMTSGPIVALILAKHNAIVDWRALMGSTDSVIAKDTAPSTIRALYGIGLLLRPHVRVRVKLGMCSSKYMFNACR